jgi:hypothetical protein
VIDLIVALSSSIGLRKSQHMFFFDWRIIMADHAIFLEVGTQPWYSIEGITEDGTHF